MPQPTRTDDIGGYSRSPRIGVDHAVLSAPWTGTLSLPNRRGPGIGWLEDATVQISQLLVRSGKDGDPAGWPVPAPAPALVALVPDQHARSFGASRS
jgi:hypothetical protein